MATTMTMSGMRATALLPAESAATAAVGVRSGLAAAALGLAGAGLGALALFGREPPFGPTGTDRLAFALAEGVLDVWLVVGAVAAGHIAAAGLLAPSGAGRYVLLATVTSAMSIAPSGVVRRRKSVAALARAAVVRAAAAVGLRRLRGDLRGRTWTGDDLRLLPVERADADIAEVLRANVRLPAGKYLLHVTAKLPAGADGVYDCGAGIDADGKTAADGFVIRTGEFRSVKADAVVVGADGLDLSVASACARTDGGPGVPPVAFAVEVADGSNIRVLKDGEVRRPRDMPKVSDRRAATGVPEVGGWRAVQPGGLHAQAPLAAKVGRSRWPCAAPGGGGDLACVVKLAPQGGKPLVDAVVPVPAGRAAVVSGDAPAGGQATAAVLDVACDGSAEAVVLERLQDMPLLAPPSGPPAPGATASVR